MKRIFLDTSALLSGLNSPSGASGLIISLFKLKKIELILSPEVLREAERIIPTKFPLLRDSLIELLMHKPIITKKLTKKQLQSAYAIIDSEDAPILKGAMQEDVDVLVTLDKRFQKLAHSRVTLPILLPGEFIRAFREEKGETLP